MAAGRGEGSSSSGIRTDEPQAFQKQINNKLVLLFLRTKSPPRARQTGRQTNSDKRIGNSMQ